MRTSLLKTVFGLTANKEIGIRLKNARHIRIKWRMRSILSSPELGSFLSIKSSIIDALNGVGLRTESNLKH